MRHTLANVMRNVATILALTAERFDPQLPIRTDWPFTIHTPTGTTAGEARITWHAGEFKETC